MAKNLIWIVHECFIKTTELIFKNRPKYLDSPLWYQEWKWKSMMMKIPKLPRKLSMYLLNSIKNSNLYKCNFSTVVDCFRLWLHVYKHLLLYHQMISLLCYNREDLELRTKLRQKEEQEHRRLIQRTTEESWKRHAYRLALPAYADGRIW